METRYSDIEMKSMISEMGINGVYKYLSARGITQQDIEDYSVTIGLAHDLGRTSDDRLAVVFPHFSIQGEVLDWWSCRLVDAQPRKAIGFAGMTTPAARPKMYCPAKEPPAAYLPPTLDWTKMEEGAVVYIHESVIKSINGAKCGHYSIGLNGVWGWGSKKHEIALVSQIKDLPWKAKKLQCVVVFDSNAASNDDVALAIRKFAERMRLVCGVTVRHHLLPLSPDDKEWGFDDFCAHHGYAHAQAWLEDLDAAEEVGFSELETLKLQLNAEVCVVKSLKKVVEQATGTMMGRGEFTDINYAHYVAYVEKGETEVQVNVPKIWLAWDKRRVVEKLEYTPGGPAIEDRKYLNLWRGMGVEPEAGDVGRWLSLLERSVPDADLRKWVIQWFAYPLQNLGAKMNTFIHMFGPPGGGKQAILAPIVKLYGVANAIVLSRERIASDFNSLYATKQFINLDELHGGSDRDGLAITNKIKMLTTSEYLAVNTKGTVEYMVSNHVNLVTSANYADAIKLDEGDRRCLVLRVGTLDTVVKDRAYWEDYYGWATSVEGAAAVYDYLMGVDLSDFNAKGWAPGTEEKEFVTDATRAPIDKWVLELREDPALVLPQVLRGAAVLTPEQLAQAYMMDDGGRVTPALKNKLGIQMHERGFKNKLVKVDGVPKRLWLITREAEKMEGVQLAKAFKALKGKV